MQPLTTTAAPRVSAGLWRRSGGETKRRNRGGLRRRTANSLLRRYKRRGPRLAGARADKSLQDDEPASAVVVVVLRPQDPCIRRSSTTGFRVDHFGGQGWDSMAAQII